MSHIAIVEQLDGKSTEWLEKVSDAQYAREFVHNGRHLLRPQAPAAAPNQRRLKD